MESSLEQYFVNNLDRAISEEWIKAYHQPLIRAASGQVSDEEAFARWEDPERGVFFASDFIPVLEKEKLTYKLDLFMVDSVLQKMKQQLELGLFVVPESVNIGRTSFECCDMVDEITRRIDDAGLTRDKLSIELSERTISSDVEFMKTQVEAFKNEGIRVWMDDYGSGYSSLLILLQIHFDLLKIDKVFTDQIERSEAGRIILTELIKTALSLGMDTVAEGVESTAQAELLKEIGCTKLQGYYFSKPLTISELHELNKKGSDIKFENPSEVYFYEQLGRINLYNLNISKQDSAGLSNYFDTLPMAIFSFSETTVSLVRCNQNYREFIQGIFDYEVICSDTDISTVKAGPGYYTFVSMKQCAESGKRAIIDDRLKDGRTVQLFLRRVAVNPLTHASAIAIVILSVSEQASQGDLTYNYIARALSEDYLNLYFVDLDTGDFTVYNADGANRDIAYEKKGTKFFSLKDSDIDLQFLPEDKKQLKKEFTKAKVKSALNKNGVFSVVTRVLKNGVPIYVSIKAVKIRGKGNNVIIGITDVDEQVKEREALTMIQEQKLIYSRIGALNGEYIYIYTVDPVTSHYNKYNPAKTQSAISMPDEGDDYFEQVKLRAPGGIYPDDVEDFMSCFSKEKVLEAVNTKGYFKHRHRLAVDGKTKYVELRIVKVNEEDGTKLVVGIFDIDDRVKQQKAYEASLNVAENKAIKDELTGVKNKRAFADAEKALNDKIASKELDELAIVVFDINDLKKVNDSLGHQAGDDLIKRSCDIICRAFKHSPVYRVGGDEFVVIAQGYDYLNLDSIVKRFKKHSIKNRLKGDAVIAIGSSRLNKDDCVSPIFARADEEMYHNKKELKLMA